MTRVQHEVVSGLRYVDSVHKMGMRGKLDGMGLAPAGLRCENSPSFSFSSPCFPDSFSNCLDNGRTVAKNDYMLGSYGPKKEQQCAQTPLDEMPSGMMARGKYTIKSKFIDDDKQVHLAWDWIMEVKKDW